MGLNTWISGGSTDGELGTNWSLNRKPIVGDTMHFDASSVVDCVFTANITCDGCQVDATCDKGSTDFGDGLTHNWGSAGFAPAGVRGIDPGTNTEHIFASGANLDMSSFTGGWSTPTGSKWTFTGGNSRWDMATGKGIVSLEVQSGCTLIASAPGGQMAQVGPWGELVNHGEITTTGGTAYGLTCYYADLRNYGVIDVNRYHQVFTASGSGDIEVNSGSIVASVEIDFRGYDAQSMSIAPGIYNSPLLHVNGFYSATYTFSPGTFTLGGNLEFSLLGIKTVTSNLDGATFVIPGHLIIDQNYNSGTLSLKADSTPAIFEIYGDLKDEQDSGAVLTLSGDVGLKFRGTADQSAESVVTVGTEWGTFDIQKDAGTLTPTDPVSPYHSIDNFILRPGNGFFDPNGVFFCILNDCTWMTGGQFAQDADAFNGSHWQVGRDFEANAQSCKATASWLLPVQGDAIANGVGEAAYCDASGGTEIDATAGPWVDNGNNKHWAFTVTYGTPPGVVRRTSTTDPAAPRRSADPAASAIRRTTESTPIPVRRT